MSEVTTTTLVENSSSGRVKVINPPPRIALVDLTPNNIGTLRKLNSVLFPVSYSDKFYNQVLEDYLSDFCKLIYYNDLPVGAVCCRIEPDPTLTNEPNKNGFSNSQSVDSNTKLYIMTLGVLAPYRCQGLASKLLDQVIESAKKTHLSQVSIPSITDQALTNNNSEPKKTTQKGKKSTATKATNNNASEASQSNKENNNNDHNFNENVIKIPKISSAYVHVQFGNDDAKKFYLNRGFKIDGEVQEYYRKIEPSGAWILTKQI